MTYLERAINGLLRGIVGAICRVDTHELNRIPLEGPGILATNHTSNLEGPIYYVFLDPRKKTAFGKIELWGNPITRFIMNLWKVVPLRRGTADRRAMEQAVKALDNGQFVGIAPEGTRSPDGTLKKGRPGAAMLAVARRVPIFPMVHWGIDEIPGNIKRLRKTHLHIRVGPPFYIRKPTDRDISPRDLRAMTDEIMYRIAILLPERMRGYYKNMDRMTNTYIEPAGEEEQYGRTG